MYYQDNELYLENTKLAEIAKKFGTPCYVYSKSIICDNWQAFDTGLSPIPHQIYYAVKANSNLSILNMLARLGSGFDIVSLGELRKVLDAGGSPDKIIFSGVAKSVAEINYALKVGIQCFNVESFSELKRINHLAIEHNTTASISLRVNPDINPYTHNYISTGLKDNKFGIDSQDIMPIVQQLDNFPAINLIGLSCHIGSQITRLQPFQQVIHHLLELEGKINKLGFNLKHLDIGGGLGIAYPGEKPPGIEEYCQCIVNQFKKTNTMLFVEPGRAIVGNSGCLLMRIEYIKQSSQKRFAVVDAGMNDFMRPALYHAWHNILPLHKKNGSPHHYDIVGPVCESSDFIGKDRELVIDEGDLLAVDMAGAYGFVMSSNYNSRTRPAEILLDGDNIQIIRHRETYDDLIAKEMSPSRA